jgi:hypothetical protein
MVKTFFALALLAMSGTAMAFQEQPALTEETAEAAAPAEGADAGAKAQPDGADEAAATATADDEQLSDEENYRAAAKALSKCRLNARRDNTPAAAAAACGSQRKRMLAAKEALKESK